MVLEQQLTISVPPLRGNPFDSRPIEGNRISEIVGRNNILSSMRELIISGSPRMILLSGERGSGRTSLINSICSFSSNDIVCQYWPEENQLLSVIHEISISFDGFEKSKSIHKISDGLVRNLESKTGPLPVVALDYPSNMPIETFLPRITPILQRLRALVIISLTPSQLNSLDNDTIGLFAEPIQLKELDIGDIQNLVDKRIMKMGKEKWLLRPNILKLIYQKTGGNPRLIVKLLQNLVDEHRGIGSLGTLKKLHALDDITSKPIEKFNSNDNESIIVDEYEIEKKIEKKPFLVDNLQNMKTPENTIISAQDDVVDMPEPILEVVNKPSSRNDDFTLIDWSEEFKHPVIDNDIVIDEELKNIVIDDEKIDNNNNNNNNNNNDFNYVKNDDSNQSNHKQIPFEYSQVNKPKVTNFGGIIGRSRNTSESIESNFVPDEESTIFIDASASEPNFPNFMNHKSSIISNSPEYDSDALDDTNEKIVDRTEDAVWTVDANEESTLPNETIYEGENSEQIMYDNPIYEEPIFEDTIIEEKLKSDDLIINTSKNYIKLPLGPKWESDNLFDRDYASQLTDAEVLVISKAKEREISPSDDELQALLQVGRPRLSQIYNGLNKAGILSVRKKGRSRMFKLSNSALSHF
ncbi:MAG: hypothetical protein HOJ64_02145 [Euryarchaeota archaeon]|jgi:hypothetical protein|nr:hypothetical protein [Euryarchaeota archaeon]MBT5613654.1 hypothetical protein [Euryarchaeota archaeon]MBT6683884.1 hypothetical protein [Euryarchaeota archaeon]